MGPVVEEVFGSREKRPSFELTGERAFRVFESREVPPTVDELPVDVAPASGTEPFGAPVDVGEDLESEVHGYSRHW